MDLAAQSAKAVMALAAADEDEPALDEVAYPRGGPRFT